MTVPPPRSDPDPWNHLFPEGEGGAAAAVAAVGLRGEVAEGEVQICTRVQPRPLPLNTVELLKVSAGD